MLSENRRERNPTEFTIKELAERAIELTDPTCRLRYEPLPSDDPARRRLDITLAKKQLDWEPYAPVREGLARPIPWFRTSDL